jgi:hypothetical protein
VLAIRITDDKIAQLQAEKNATAQILLRKATNARDGYSEKQAGVEPN